MGICAPGKSTNSFSPALCAWRMTTSRCRLPAPVEDGELAVGVAVGEGLFVLVPQQHERDVGTPQLEVDPLESGCGRGLAAGAAEVNKRCLEGVVVEVVGQRPAEPGGLGPPHVVADGGEGDAERGAHLAQAEALAESQTEYISDLAHADMGPGHGTSSNVLAGRVRVKVPCPPHVMPAAPSLLPRGVRKLRNRCTDSTGMGVRKPPESSAAYEHRAPLKVHVSHGEVDQFRPSQAAGVENLQDSAVSQTQRSRDLRGAQEGRHLLCG